MCCRCAVVVVIECAVDVMFASRGRCSVTTAVPTAHLPPEANYLQNVCTVDVRFASRGRCAADVLQMCW